MTTKAQPGQFDRQKSNVESQDVNWGLLRHINRRNPWPGPGVQEYQLRGIYSYQLSGEGTDIVVTDTGVEAYHPEFLLDQDSTICENNQGTVTETQLNTRRSLRGITRFNNQTITVGDSGEIYRGTTPVQQNKNYSLSDVQAWQGQLYAVGGYYAESVNARNDPNSGQGPGIRILTSTTGQVWQDITPYGDSNSYARSSLRGVAGSATSLVTVGTVNYAFRRFNAPQYGFIASTARILRWDGQAWTNIETQFTPPLNYNLNRVRYTGTRYVAVGDNGTVIVSATDGVTWTRSATGVTCGLQDLAANASGTLMIAVGRGGCVLTSADGTVWTQQASGTVSDLFCVTYYNGQFWAMGQNGAGITSADGVTWSAFNTATENTVYAADGQYWATGAGTRVQALDWSSLGVTGIPSSVSIGGYLGDATAAEPLTSGGGHGSNVTSIAAGNSNGWAKAARIYSIRIFSGIDMTTGSTLGAIPQAKYAQLIRAFHLSKAVPRRPTIANFSLQSVISQSAGQVYARSVVYRGQETVNATTNAYTNAALGMIYPTIPIRNSAIDADIATAVSAGVICVGAAGNFYYKQDVSGGDDYDNYANFQSGARQGRVYYQRGSSPGAADGVICVGALDSTFYSSSNQVQEQKVDFSQTGPRVNVYAAGVNIMGAYRNVGYGSNYAVVDARSLYTQQAYYVNKISGTSQAAPQIAGMACLLAEQNPQATAADILADVTALATAGAMTVTGAELQNGQNLPNYSNLTSLQQGQNLLAYMGAVPYLAGTVDFINGIQGQGEIDLE